MIAGGLVFWLVASLASLAASYAAPRRSQPSQQDNVPPSNDSFYDVPVDVGKHKPGAILSYRKSPSPIAAFGIVAENIENTYQILYRTTDALGNPTATVLTVMVPYKADYSKVLSYQVAQDTATIDCAPSYTLQLQSNNNPVLRSDTIQLQLLLMEASLTQGWVVVTPDFQGPKGSFASNKMAAHAVLDGVRAALNSGHITGIKEKARTTMWGYSGGASVTQAAAVLQPQYAPDLEIAGAAIGGASDGNIEDIHKLNQGPRSGFIPLLMLGLASQHPDLRGLIDQSVKPEYKDLFYKPLHQCLEANLLMFRNRDITGMFRNGTLPSIISAIEKVLNEDANVASFPKIPLFWYQADHDDISEIDRIVALVAQYCAGGANIQLQRDNESSLNHRNYGLIGAPQAISWLKEVMGGKNIEPGCRTNTVSTSEIDPEFLAIFPEAIRELLRAAIKISDSKPT